MRYNLIGYVYKYSYQWIIDINLLYSYQADIIISNTNVTFEDYNEIFKYNLKNVFNQLKINKK